MILFTPVLHGAPFGNPPALPFPPSRVRSCLVTRVPLATIVPRCRHACEPEKLASGLPIVEVDITTEEEARALASGINEFDDKTKFHNFRPQGPETVPCTMSCGSEVAAFHVFKSGKAFMQTDHPLRVSAVRRRPSTVYSRRIRRASHRNEAFVSGLEFREEALLDGKVRHLASRKMRN